MHDEVWNVVDVKEASSIARQIVHVHPDEHDAPTTRLSRRA
jgi:hypothetical protein